jgi:hypothetical protein
MKEDPLEDFEVLLSGYVLVDSLIHLFLFQGGLHRVHGIV